MDILSGIDILSSETGQVFYDHAIDPSSLNIVQHALKGWTVKIRPCISIVYTNGDNIKFRLILQKVQNKLLLESGLSRGDYPNYIFFECVNYPLSICSDGRQ